MAESAKHLFVFTSHKAGMQHQAQQRAQQVTYEMSKDTLFFKHAEKLDERTSKRIDLMREKARQITPAQEEILRRRVSRDVAEFEKRRNVRRVCVCVDMDMFYAQVEMRDDPSLEGKPMAVGGMGMICTANYTARKFGVRSAMPGFIAKRLCPQLIFVAPNFDKYTKVADQIKTVFAQYDEHFRSMSLDEAYLDITQYLHRHRCTNSHTREQTNDGQADTELQRAEVIVAEMREKIFELTGLTASAGIGSNTLLAKMCSDIHKPNGQFALGRTTTQIHSFIRALPVRKIHGVGKVTERVLTALGFEKCKDVWESMHIIYHVFTQTQAQFLLRSCMGVSADEHVPWDAPAHTPQGVVTRKSIGHERTFQALSDMDKLAERLRELCEQVCSQMESERLFGRNVCLKLKLHTFDVFTRAASTHSHTNSVDDVFPVARSLLLDCIEEHCKCLHSTKSDITGNHVCRCVCVRLMGVRVSHFRNQYDPNTHTSRSIGDFFTQDHSMEQKHPPPITHSNILKHEVDILEEHSDSKTQQMMCPVCSLFETLDLDALNCHLDACLRTKTQNAPGQIQPEIPMQKHKQPREHADSRSLTQWLGLETDTRKHTRANTDTRSRKRLRT